MQRYGVVFQVEPALDRIRNLSPVEAAMGGTFGTGARLNVRVKAEDMAKFDQLFRDLYSE